MMMTLQMMTTQQKQTISFAISKCRESVKENPIDFSLIGAS